MIDFKYIHYTAFVMSLLGILAFIADLGFSQPNKPMAIKRFLFYSSSNGYVGDRFALLNYP